MNAERPRLSVAVRILATLMLALPIGVAFPTAASAAPGDLDEDGILDIYEDADTDVDGDPATNPGPDTDGDTIPNYLDADDDGDTVPTASENADPNSDGNPGDALDTDGDTVPDYLDPYTTVGYDCGVDQTEISAIGCGALIRLYENTDGANWTANTNWLTGDPSTWQGVTVTTGGVTALNLPTNNLTGLIPIEIGDLTQLTHLYLQFNNLTGPIPIQIGNLIQLTHLNVNRNNLTGPIPTQIGNLINLRQLYLSHNTLTGPVPIELGDLSQLIDLHLNGNELTGPIPVELSNLANLAELYLSNNQLEGAVPSTVAALTNLTTLWLGTNLCLTADPATAAVVTSFDTNWQDGCADSDGDGVLDLYEDANTDADGDPSTNPGPDTDGDATPDYLDADDDGDTIPTVSENADPNSDGNPVDALDTNGDTVPDYLDPNTAVGYDCGVDQTEISVTECLALVLLYENTDGTNWTDNTNWLMGEPSTWHGVTVATGGVTQLNFIRNNLSGPIPVEIDSFTSLTRLYLYGNNLSGPIPVEMGNLTQLTTLYLQDNDLSGPIPVEIGNLTQLTTLYLQDNDLSGPIPVEIGNLTQLPYLSLNNNDLSGPIPVEIGNLTSLTVLYLNNNNLSGSLPTEIGDLTQLTRLYLQNNNFSGPMPVEIGNLIQLTTLYVNDNSLSGSLPTEIGDLTQLTRLYFYNNSLSGPLPVELGNLTQLTRLYLFNNSLSGSLPTEIGDLGNLTNLHLADNNFTGPVPAELGNLTNLTQLDLHTNQLSGLVPSSVTTLASVTIFQLHTNACLTADPATAAFITSFDISWQDGCTDSDGDGLWDSAEDADTDADGDPTTNPGPDTDGDTVPNYLDADDDGDAIPTVSENADPNGDGNQHDAVDGDWDGQPDYLDLPTSASRGTVGSEQKISDLVGGLTATLNDNDAFGISITAIGDLDGDGTVDLAVGASGDDDGGINRGAVYVLFLNADGTVGSEQKISDLVGGLTAALNDNDGFGISITAIGDLDGDGTVDLAVGASGDDDGGINRGAVYVLFLNPDGTVRAEQKISEADGGLGATLSDNDAFGVSVTAIGDLDGDGYNDIVIGSPGDDDGNSDAGAVYVLFLNADGTIRAEQKISDTAGGLSGSLGDLDHFGAAVSGLGDLDGDGYNDIVIGSPGDDDGNSDAGAVYVLFLNADGTVRAEQKISDTAGGLSAGLSGSDSFGMSVSAIGDVDGDGTQDILVGASGDDDGGPDRGAAYVLFLNADGTANTEQKISENAGGLPVTLTDYDHLGTVAGLGDINADGIINVAIGAWADDDGGSDRGAVHIIDFSLNRPPTFSQDLTILTSAEGETVTQYSAATDLDDDPSIWSALGLPPGLTIDATTGVVGGTITSNAAVDSPYTASITVADGHGGTDVDVFSWAITFTNQAPIMDPIPNVTTGELVPLSLIVTASDPNLPANTITFSATGLPPGASLDVGSGVLAWTPSEVQGPGTFTIVVTATDDGSPNLADTQSFSITVTETNAPPVLGPIGDLSSAEGDSVTIDVAAVDVDLPIGSLSFAASGLPLGISIDPDTGQMAGLISYEAFAASPHNVNVQVVDDDGGSSDTNFVWSVTDTNRAPAIEPITSQVVEASTMLRVEVDASDPDHNELAYVVLAGPVGLVVDPTTGVISWTPRETDAGFMTVTIEVRDNGEPVLASRTSFVITVEPAPPPTADLVVGPVANDDAFVIAYVSSTELDVLRNDEGQNFTITSVSSPEGATVEIVDSRLLFDPAVGFSGSTFFTYQIRDSVGLTSSALVTVTVMGPTVAPETLAFVGFISPPDDQPGGELRTLSLASLGLALLEAIKALTIPSRLILGAAFWLVGLTFVVTWLVPGPVVSAITNTKAGERATAQTDDLRRDVFHFRANADYIWTYGRKVRRKGRTYRRVETPAGPGLVDAGQLSEMNSTQWVEARVRAV